MMRQPPAEAHSVVRSSHFRPGLVLSIIMAGPVATAGLCAAEVSQFHSLPVVTFLVFFPTHVIPRILRRAEGSRGAEAVDMA